LAEEVDMKRTWSLLIGLAAMLAWVNLAVSQERPKQPAAPKLPASVMVLPDLQYIKNGHERNRLDLYLSEKAEGQLPLIVWIHGGGWQGGSKESCPAVPFATKGYAVASINYRLSQHAVFPAQIEDCKAAIRWLRGNATKYHLDPDHIGVWGGSAGGHLVSLLGTTGGVKGFEGSGGNLDQSSRVQCVVDWFGPTDFVSWDPNFNKAVISMIAHLLGSTVQESQEKARKASPLFYVGKDAAPFLIVHGDQDNLVPLAQSQAIGEALKKAGVEVKFVVIKGSGHGGPGFTNPENSKLIENFFAKHLGKGHEQPAATTGIRAESEIRFKVRQRGITPGPIKTPDGKITVRAEGLTAQLYDAITDKPMGPPLEHRQRRSGMQIVTWAFSSDGKLLATASGERRHRDDTVGEVRVWEVPSGKLVIEINDAKADLGYVHAVAFSEDGKTVLVDCEEISGK
jgi:acetyl esterase/lipase